MLSATIPFSVANENSTTIGFLSAVNATNSVALGKQGTGTYSSVTEECRIQNVAAGLVGNTSTDAINGSQLYAVAKVADLANTTAAVANSTAVAANSTTTVAYSTASTAHSAAINCKISATALPPPTP